MSKETKDTSRKQENTFRHDQENSVSQYQEGYASLDSPLAGLGLGGHSLEAQANTLQRLSKSDSQHLISRIGNLQGNTHVIQLMSLMRKKDGDSASSVLPQTNGDGRVEGSKEQGVVQTKPRERIQRSPFGGDIGGVDFGFDPNLTIPEFDPGSLDTLPDLDTAQVGITDPDVGLGDVINLPEADFSDKIDVSGALQLKDAGYSDSFIREVLNGNYSFVNVMVANQLPDFVNLPDDLKEFLVGVDIDLRAVPPETLNVTFSKLPGLSGVAEVEFALGHGGSTMAEVNSDTTAATTATPLPEDASVPPPVAQPPTSEVASPDVMPEVATSEVAPEVAPTGSLLLGLQMGVLDSSDLGQNQTPRGQNFQKLYARLGHTLTKFDSQNIQKITDNPNLDINTISASQLLYALTGVIQFNDAGMPELLLASDTGQPQLPPALKRAIEQEVTGVRDNPDGPTLDADALPEHVVRGGFGIVYDQDENGNLIIRSWGVPGEETREDNVESNQENNRQLNPYAADFLLNTIAERGPEYADEVINALGDKLFLPVDLIEGETNAVIGARFAYYNIIGGGVRILYDLDTGLFYITPEVGLGFATRTGLHIGPMPIESLPEAGSKLVVNADSGPLLGGLGAGARLEHDIGRGTTSLSGGIYHNNPQVGITQSIISVDNDGVEFPQSTPSTSLGGRVPLGSAINIDANGGPIRGGDSPGLSAEGTIEVTFIIDPEAVVQWIHSIGGRPITHEELAILGRQGVPQPTMNEVLGNPRGILGAPGQGPSLTPGGQVPQIIPAGLPPIPPQSSVLNSMPTPQTPSNDPLDLNSLGILNGTPAPPAPSNGPLDLNSLGILNGTSAPPTPSNGPLDLNSLGILNGMPAPPTPSNGPLDLNGLGINTPQSSQSNNPLTSPTVDIGPLIPPQTSQPPSVLDIISNPINLEDYVNE